MTAGPSLAVEVVDCQPTTRSGVWNVTWLIANQGSEPVALQAAWIPHGQFRGEGRLPLAGEIGPAASVRLEFPVASHAAPGSTVENAFLILRVLVRARPWRVFSRMRIAFDAHGVPQPIVEAVTTQAVGAA